MQVYWVESSSYDIAVCENGTVSLKKEGTVTLTAYCQDNIQIKVTFDIKPPLATTTTTTATTTTTTTTPTTTTIPIVTEPSYTLGDVNEDGKVDSVDASLVLAEYSAIQTGEGSKLTYAQSLAADVNKDGRTDSSDASGILEYYSCVSTGQKPSWG